MLASAGKRLAVFVSLILLALSGTPAAAGIRLEVLWRYTPSEEMEGYLPGQGLMVFHNWDDVPVVDKQEKLLKKYKINLNGGLPPPIVVEGDYFAAGEENGTRKS